MQDYIIIGFSTHKKFNILSSIIKIVEHTPFSHVYIKLYSKSLERWLIYQASGLAVNFIGIEKFDEKNTVITEFSFSITEETKTKILQNAVDTIGTPYGMKDLIGIGLVRLAALFNKKIKNPFSDGKATYICSELASTILVENLGFKLEDLDSVTPKDVYEQIANRQT